MPIYMDRHDLPESVTAEEVARLHQEDLKVEDEFGCKGLTYWFDDQRKTAFCLIKAPNKKALKDMHKHAHGDIPNSIVEVDPSVVESFLGRIEDPEKAMNADLNIINDPAFRVLVRVDLRSTNLKSLRENDSRANLAKCRNTLRDFTAQYGGRETNAGLSGCLFSFDSVTSAVNFALDVNKEFDAKWISADKDLDLHIGLSSGVPFEEPDGLFRETQKMAERLCNSVQGRIVVTSEVKDHYESENLNNRLDVELVRSLHPADEKFLNGFIDFTEEVWDRTNLKVEDFTSGLGMSKAQLYRKVKSITGRSLITFIRQYRLGKAVDLLLKKKGNISEVAFDTGFNSPAYFSKCFHSAYGVLPSEVFK